jgi:hypothetical protein
MMLVSVQTRVNDFINFSVLNTGVRNGILLVAKVPPKPAPPTCHLAGLASRARNMHMLVHVCVMLGARYY